MLGYLLSPTVQFEDINGKPLVGGKVYVYKANTTTLATTYSDYNGTMNTNPVILDLLGHCTVIADDGEYYDIEVYNKDNILLFSAHLVAVGGEGGSASVSGFDVKAGYGIKVGKSVSGNKEIFTVSADPTYLATKTDLNGKQNTLIPGNNISISGDNISVTGLKTINVTSPLQKTETTSAINLSIDTSGIQTTLSAGTNIDEVKLSNNIVDLKHDNCSASINSIAIGRETLASGDCSFAEGDRTSAIGDYSHAEGTRTSALRYGDHAEGHSTVASGEYSHAEGYGSMSIGYQSHAEGYNTSAFDAQSHSEGDRTQSIGYQSHAEGYKTSAIGPASHSEGEQTIASGNYSHAEGDRARTIGQYSHAEGSQTSAIGARSHAEGYITNTIGQYSHAEGDQTSAVYFGDHVEGDHCIAGGGWSHAEGLHSVASGSWSHSEGYYTSAFGVASHAEGENTIASGNYQTVIGKYNAPNTTDLFQIGCGSNDNDRKNALEIKDDNTIWYNYNGSMTQLPAPPVYFDSYNNPSYYSFVALDGQSGTPSWLNVPGALGFHNGIEKNNDENCYSLVDRSANKTCEVDADFVIKIDALPTDSTIIIIGYGVEDEKAGSPLCRTVLFYDTGIYYIHLHCLVYGKDFYFFAKNDSYLMGGGTASVYLQNVTIRSV